MGALSGLLPEGMRGKDLLRRGVDPARGALLRQRAELLRTPSSPGCSAGHDPDLSHVTRHRGALPADPRGRLRRRHRDAVRRPVHLAARRHPGQGRQDDDGELAGAAGARSSTPRSSSWPARIPLDQRVPRGGTATKYALRRAMEQIVPEPILHRRKLGFPVPTGDFLAGPLHEWARRDRRGEPDRRVARPRRGCGELLDRAAHGRAAEQADRPSGLGGAGLHGLARHLRRGADPARHPRDRLPRPL